MGSLAELPVELTLYTVSFLTREIILDPMQRLPSIPRGRPPPELVPDLPAINAVTQTNRVFHRTLNQTLYKLCASVKSLGSLALLFTVEHDLGGAFDKLVAAGVSVEGQFKFNYRQCSLLHIAAGMRRQLIVSKLLGIYGEEMLARLYARDSKKRSALDYAVHEGHGEIVRLLVRPPAAGELGQLEAHKQYISRALLKSPREANVAIYEYLVSEGYATINDNVTLMQLLLVSGADPNGSLPLFRVASIPAAEALLTAGANIHATGSKGRNVLAYRPVENTELLHFFLGRGVDPNHEDDKGETPLHHACSKAGVASVELLLQFGATTVEKACRRGATPVHCAMHRAMHTGKVEVVELLGPLVRNPSLKSEVATWLSRYSKESKEKDME